MYTVRIQEFNINRWQWTRNSCIVTWYAIAHVRIPIHFSTWAKPWTLPLRPRISSHLHSAFIHPPAYLSPPVALCLSSLIAFIVSSSPLLVCVRGITSASRSTEPRPGDQKQSTDKCCSSSLAPRTYQLPLHRHFPGTQGTPWIVSGPSQGSTVGRDA